MLTKGISLIELLVALSIVVILILVSVPVFTSFAQRYRLTAVAENLQYQLQFARSKAIENNTNVYVSFTTGDTWCYGINAGSACNCAVPSGCSLGTTSYGSAQQLTLSTTGMSGNTLYFEGSHGAANAAATATFTLYNDPSTLMTVSIGHLGNSQLCSTGVSGYTAC